MKKSRYVAACAVIAAFSVVTSYFPVVFLVPIIITATFQDIRLTAFASAFFGCFSYVLCLNGSTPLALAFVANPLIPILPRLAVGAVAHSSFALSKRLLKSDFAASFVCAVCATITNSVLVIFMLLCFTPPSVVAFADMRAFVPFMLASALTELVFNALIIPPLNNRLRAANAALIRK